MALSRAEPRKASRSCPRGLLATCFPAGRPDHMAATCSGDELFEKSRIKLLPPFWLAANIVATCTYPAVSYTRHAKAGPKSVGLCQAGCWGDEHAPRKTRTSLPALASVIWSVYVVYCHSSLVHCRVVSVVAKTGADARVTQCYH